MKETNIPIPIENEMRESYLDYAMSVIVSRALPDVRDGFKPVHRRILYAMDNLNLIPSAAYKKSATIVGDVLGKYHPHGDSSVYDALVRLAQNFNMRYPLIDGHGNFGSVDGDPAAAYRYTEAKMSAISVEMLKDLDKDTVNFSDNFDGSLKEPSVLPSNIPNLLVNGSMGIAVGMATNIPPHNLSDIIDALTYIIDNPSCDNEELIDIVKAPDFPTGGMIMGVNSCKEAYRKGRGSITLRAKIEIEKNKRTSLIITEIPYQVNKTKLLEQIAEGIKQGKISHINDMRDESDRNGMRIVIELASNANMQLVMNQLYKHSNLQCTFGIIMLALVDGQPQQLTLEEMLRYYLEHRKDVVTRRTKFDLNKAKDRAHIVEGLLKAIDYIDEIIAIIRSSKDRKEAEKKLIARFEFSKVQAGAILEMQLQKLTGLEKSKLEKEYNELIKLISYLEDLLESPRRLIDTIKKEFAEIKKKYGDKRHTKIVAEGPEEFGIEDLIPEEKTIVTLTQNGFLKRAPVANSKQISDIPEEVDGDLNCVTTTHHFLLMLSNLGKIYRLKVYELSDSRRGTAPINLVPLSNGEKIIYIFTLKTFTQGYDLTLITKRSYIKRASLPEYESARKAGIFAIKLDEGDEVIKAILMENKSFFEFIAISRAGSSILFNTENIKNMGRTAKGTRMLKLIGNDEIKILLVPEGGKELVVISENGVACRMSIHQYRLPTKLGRRVEIMKIDIKKDSLIGAALAEKSDVLEILTTNGDSYNKSVQNIVTAGRSRKGEKLIDLSAGCKVCDIYILERQIVE